MSDLTEKFTALEEQLTTQHGETTEAIAAVQGDETGTLVNILNALNSNGSTLVDIRTLLEDLSATLEIIGNNLSLNAQNQQNILLGTVGACCEDVTPLTGTPTDMCQKSQQLIASMPSFGLFIEAAMTDTTLPSVQAIINAFTVNLGEGAPNVLLNVTGANKILAAIAKIGPSRMSEIIDASQDSAIQEQLLNILGTATNSQQAYNQIQNIDPSGFGVASDAVAAFLSFFQPSVVASLWADPPIFTGEGFEDICGGEPPVEGGGWFNAGGSTDTGIGPSNIVGTWEMSGSGSGSLFPNGFEAHGLGPMYCRVCYNTTSQPDKTIRLWTMSGSVPVDLIGEGVPDDVFTFTFPSEDSWGVEMVDPGDPLESEQAIALVFAWSNEDTDHCPE